MRLLWIGLLAGSSAFAGPLIVGGRGGAGLNDSAVSALGHVYTVGPTVGVRLPLGFSVEGDALYNRRSLGLGLSNLGAFNTHWDWWEFPVMGKFTAGNGPIAPVFGAGVTVQRISNFGSVPSYVLTRSTSNNSVGFVAGGGVQFRVGPLRVTPELRYTRWNSGNFTQALVDTLTGGRNQAQFLVGFTF